jgi:hypothetical protein
VIFRQPQHRKSHTFAFRKRFRPCIEQLEARQLLATLLVTNTDDAGPGSLRQAILDSNSTASVLDSIEFSIPGAGVKTISPTSALPMITGPVSINGYSQAGASANNNPVGQELNTVLMVEVAGNLAGTGAIGLRLGAGSGGSTIKGLAVNRFSAQGIQIETSGNTIAGNFIGTNAAGTAALPNGDNGVIIFSGSNNVIGGTASADRNLLSGNDDNGVALVFAAAKGNVIQGNLIGTDHTGTQDLGNALYRHLCISSGRLGDWRNGTWRG